MLGPHCVQALSCMSTAFRVAFLKYSYSSIPYAHEIQLKQKQMFIKTNYWIGASTRLCAKHTYANDTIKCTLWLVTTPNVNVLPSFFNQSVHLISFTYTWICILVVVFVFAGCFCWLHRFACSSIVVNMVFLMFFIHCFYFIFFVNFFIVSLSPAVVVAKLPSKLNG